MLDREFWLKELMPVHVLVLDPDTDWKTFAQDRLVHAEQHYGVAIPHTSQPQPGDEEKLRLLRGKLGVQEHLGEEDCLDRIYHLLQADEVVDHVSDEDVFFLLYRLIE
jgi:hypothetical protein